MEIMARLAALPGIAAFAACFYLAGSFFRRWLPYSDLWRGIVQIGLGMGLLVYVLALAGTAGIVHAGVVLGFAAVVMLLRFRQIPDLLRWTARACLAPFQGTGFFFSKLHGIFLVSLFLIAAFSLLPETANDALCYQLFLPKQFLLRGSTLPIPYDINSYIPLFMNHLYLAGLLFKSVALAKLFHALCAVLLFLAVLAAVEEETRDPRAGFLAALALLLTPTLINEATTTYVDIAASLFTFLSVCLLQRALKGEPGPHALWAGVFSGFAVSCKILALIALLPLGVLILIRMVESRDVRARAPRLILALAAGFLAASGFWFVRNIWLTHNPVYPYLGKLFGTAEFGFIQQFRDMGPPKTLLNYLGLPFLLTFYPEGFDRGHWLGPFYLAVLPFALYAAWKLPAQRPKLLFSWVFLTVWFLFFHNARFLFQTVPLYAAAAAAGASVLVPRMPRPFRSMLALGYLGLAAGLFALGIYHYRLPLKVLAGKLPEDAYLRQVERSFPAAQWANGNLPVHARLFNAEEIRMFYFDRESLRETWFYLGTRYAEEDAAPEALALRLKKEKFTHLLLTSAQQKTSEDPALEKRYALLRGLAARPDLARPLAHIPSENVREVPETYDFYELTPP